MSKLCLKKSTYSYVALQYGEKCSDQYTLADDIQHYVRDRCDENAHLACVNNKCLCRFGPAQEWDSVKKSCVSGEGGKCFIPDKKFTHGLSCSSGLKCVIIQNEFYGQRGICIL